MDFEVVAPARGTPSSSATVVLQQDRWDDFGYGLIAAGEIVACKSGRRTLITVKSAKAWLNHR